MGGAEQGKEATGKKKVEKDEDENEIIVDVKGAVKSKASTSYPPKSVYLMQ